MQPITKDDILKLSKDPISFAVMMDEYQLENNDTVTWIYGSNLAT